MQFEDAVRKVATATDLKRLAKAHVVEHRQLSGDDLVTAVIKTKAQYVDRGVIQQAVEALLYREETESFRALSRIFLVDVLLQQYDSQLAVEESDERVIAFEQSMVDRSNEVDLPALACGDKNSERYKELELYKFVLGVAWDHQDSVSPDEANLLRKLRARLRINETDHRILGAHLGKFPLPNNVTHNRNDVADIRKRLQEKGLLVQVRGEDGVTRDVVPQETAEVLRDICNITLRKEAYAELLDHKLLRQKSHLREVLDQQKVPYSKYDTVEVLKDRVIADVPAPLAIASSSPRFGLSSEELTELCKDLSLQVSGSMPERIDRIIAHYAQLRPRVPAGGDERALWLRHYEELAFRDYDGLRKQHIIEKDLEVEHKFEDATRYLFDKLLGHTPLKQAGTNHCDGLLSLKSSYLMWDNKSRERAGRVNLKEHISQFHGYIEASEKPVPVFMVIAPDFTEESEVEATRYHAEYFDRNIVLIRASELKALAEEWAHTDNRDREQPFPLGLFAASGRYDRKRLGKLY